MYVSAQPLINLLHFGCSSDCMRERHCFASSSLQLVFGSALNMPLCNKEAFAAWLSTAHQLSIMIFAPFSRIAFVLLQVDSQPKDEKYVEVVLKLLDQADIFSASDLVGVKPERLVTSNVSPGMEGFLTRAIKVHFALYVFL